MNCTWVKDNLCDILDGLLPSDMEEKYQEHLAECVECRMLLAEIKLDQQALASLPRVSPPAELMAGVLASVRQPARKTLWPFFAPRLVPVAAALVIMILGLNLWTAYFPYPLATHESARREDQLDSRRIMAIGEEPSTTPPEATDKSLDASLFSASQVAPPPARPSFLVVSSMLGGSIFVVWGAIVFLWYKRA